MSAYLATRLGTSWSLQILLGKKKIAEFRVLSSSPVAAAHNCCPDCGGALRQFGEDVSEQLERIPATFKVIRHVRPKFACAGCESVVEAPAPSRPIERGLAGPGLLAYIVTSKFADYLPLYRLEDIFQRQGFEIARATQSVWCG